MSAADLTCEGIPVELAVGLQRLVFSAVDYGSFDPTRDPLRELDAVIAKHERNRRDFVALLRAALQGQQQQTAGTAGPVDIHQPHA